MRYEQFKNVWASELRECGLRILHPEPTETVDLVSMERSYTVYVEPAGRQDAEPFFVAGTLSWRWGSLQAARTRSTEEDMLTELLGRNVGDAVETEAPVLRVDIGLKASLMHGKGIPMPSKPVWCNWAREVVGRLERIERLLPDEVMTEGERGLTAVLAWQGDPVLEVECSPEGELKLNAVEVSAWQLITLPRVWDNTEREHDEHPSEQLAAMFKRVRLAMNGFMEAMDHLTKQPRSEPGSPR